VFFSPPLFFDTQGNGQTPLDLSLSFILFYLEMNRSKVCPFPFFGSLCARADANANDIHLHYSPPPFSRKGRGGEKVCDVFAPPPQFDICLIFFSPGLEFFLPSEQASFRTVCSSSTILCGFFFSYPKEGSEGKHAGSFVLFPLRTPTQEQPSVGQFDFSFQRGETDQPPLFLRDATGTISQDIPPPPLSPLGRKKMPSRSLEKATSLRKLSLLFFFFHPEGEGEREVLSSFFLREIPFPTFPLFSTEEDEVSFLQGFIREFNLIDFPHIFIFFFSFSSGKGVSSSLRYPDCLVPAWISPFPPFSTKMMIRFFSIKSKNPRLAFIPLPLLYWKYSSAPPRIVPTRKHGSPPEDFSFPKRISPFTSFSLLQTGQLETLLPSPLTPPFSPGRG